MQLMKCSKCGAHPEVFHDPDTLAVEIECRCGAFRWAPIEHGDTDRRIMDFEVEATSLWNVAQGAHRADVQPLQPDA
jgi:hypothetical protein